LNQAVHYFGATLEAELDQVEGKPEQQKRERQHILDRVLQPGKKPKNRFADPAGKF